ncbi:MAG: tetratricopeptide repeat protein [Proteobacteria bacterium]|nr:tetratricopeptide repeat protein [Pseudomonadota bacterium]
MTSVWAELRRRNVVKVAVAYAIVGWLLVEVASVLFETFEAPAWVMKVFATVIIMGFPLAMFFAWAYELTPEGLKKEKDVDRSQSITHLTGRNIDYLIIAALVLALGFFAFDKFVLDPSRDAELVQATTEAVTEQAAESGKSEIPDKSIAVLAFTDLSPEADQEYFSDGISEELLNVLAKIPGLRVAARTSSFQFKGENRDAIEIGQQLNVALVLEGSVRKAGVQLRITAQLIDASTGFHLWSETYDRELVNIFAVQDEISAAIVGALKEHLGLEVEAAPRVVAAANTEAHNAYLRGRYLVAQRGRAGVEGAVGEFEKAIAFDPEYALAHAELAMATLLLIQQAGLPVTEAIARAVPHAERAMDLDPTLAEAQAAIGFVLLEQGNLEEALTHFEQAIQINPNYSIVYTWMGSILGGDLGVYAEGFTRQETALRLNPLSVPARYNYIQLLINRNRLAEADRELEKFASIAPGAYASVRGFRTSVGGKWANRVLAGLDALRINPESVFGRNDLTQPFAAIGLGKEALAISEAPLPDVLRVLGRPEDAVTTAQARLAEDPDSLRARSDLGLAFASVGDYVRARPILEEMWQRSGGRVTFTGLFQADNAAALIAIRRDAGEEAEVGELLAAIKDNVRRYREAGVIRAKLYLSVDYEEGLADYLAGERERGLALIANGLEDGYFIRSNEAYLKVLYDDPGFAPILASQEARQARERDRFLAIVCTDNPYAAVWQPAEGTCERFAAEGGN